MRSDQHKLELRRLGNKLPVLGEANSLCDVGNISLQHTMRDLNDSETVYFVIIRAQFARVMYLFVKLRVFSLVFDQLRRLAARKNTNSRFLRFFVRSVPLFRSLMLTPMIKIKPRQERKRRADTTMCVLSFPIWRWKANGRVVLHHHAFASCSIMV